MAPGPRMKRGERMPLQLIARVSREDIYTRLDLEANARDRERLLDAVRAAGLQPNVVLRLAEALTGHPWECLGQAEITVVARALLEAANRVACGPTGGARPCAR